ncbi:hypothetical protein EC988_008164, partial [Linderina pennispora]
SRACYCYPSQHQSDIICTGCHGAGKVRRGGKAIRTCMQNRPPQADNNIGAVSTAAHFAPGAVARLDPCDAGNAHIGAEPGNGHTGQDPADDLAAGQCIRCSLGRDPGGGYSHLLCATAVARSDCEQHCGGYPAPA